MEPRLIDAENLMTTAVGFNGWIGASMEPRLIDAENVWVNGTLVLNQTLQWSRV